MLSQPITYKPQFDYQGGRLMCTAASAEWATGCLQGMPPACTDQQMDTIMRRARDMHLQICLRLGGPGAAPFMLKQDEVLDNMVLPDGLTRTEIFVAASEKHLPPDVPNLIGLPWLPARITPRSGMLFTAHGHTLAVFCDAAGNIFVFDSAGAYVRRVSRDELVMVLDTVHRTDQAFEYNSTATLLSFDVAAPSEKESKYYEDISDDDDGSSHGATAPREVSTSLLETMTAAAKVVAGSLEQVPRSQSQVAGQEEEERGGTHHHRVQRLLFWLAPGVLSRHFREVWKWKMRQPWSHDSGQKLLRMLQVRQVRQ